MTRQESFEKHWADMHDLPVETLAQYRWTEKDGYRLPGIAAGYRNYCAGWDAVIFSRASHVKITLKPEAVERIRKSVSTISDPMTVQGPRYE